MTDKEMIDAYDRIVKLKEFKDKEFVFGFSSKLAAWMFAHSSDPDKDKQLFWESLYRKVNYTADQLEKKFNDEQDRITISKRRDKICHTIIYRYLNGKTPKE